MDPLEPSTVGSYTGLLDMRMTKEMAQLYFAVGPRQTNSNTRITLARGVEARPRSLR